MPTETIGGEKLSALSQLVITRDMQIVKTFDNPIPGETLSFYDTSYGNGYHLYSAYGVNDAGDGVAIDKMGFTGINKASAALNPKAVEHGDTGLVTLTWEAPQTNADGYPMNPELVTYAVMSQSMDFTDELSIDIQAVPEGEFQRFEYFMIMSITDGGVNTSEYAKTDPAAYGIPYSLPFVESVANSEVSTGWIFNCKNFKIAANCDDPVAQPVDDDGGMLEASYYMPAELLAYSAKIAIPAEGNNIFSFYYFNNPGKSDILRPLINDIPVKEIIIGEGNQSEWVKVEIPLDSYAGSTIRLGFSIDSKESNVLIDNIKVANQLSHDLKVNALLAPSVINTGETTPVTVKVANIGSETADGYTVDLIVDNKVLMSKEGVAIQKDGVEAFVFDLTPDVTWGEVIDVTAVVNYSEDMDITNNQSDTKSIVINTPQYPYIKDLSAEENSNGVTLMWSAPDLDNNIVCENFESFVPYSTDGGNGWTTYDGDMLVPYSFIEITLPNEFVPKAWMTLDISSPQYNASWSTVSGNRIMASFSSEFGPVNDWLISPELDGRAQTVSLFARSYVADYGLEEFSLYYSTSSANPEDFQQIGGIITPNTQWKEYEWDLPEGTKYFAVVGSSNDHFVLLVDDVTFCLPFDKENNKLTGFNVYRDNSLLGSVGAEATSFTDTEAKDGLHDYNVTVVYANGESKLSNTVSVNTVSVETVSNSGIRVMGGKEAIIIEGETSEDARIYDAAGKQLSKTNVSLHTVIPVEKGIYIVKVGDEVFKVAVK